ncbi:hypothetical protein SAMN04487898_104366 [Pedobacter sp. ok626]|uniref:tetratricopeptide repeat protein n=1 Tax=Pedobacter sp. ok626 TaxID=1761882 RepID=UPI00088E92B3|nr:hypothetical protein [Pedobacter sp. ok626]SDJ82565.1 hypothetical protein SAMN04487898_104366 [Pedobacter sp. ok626]
MKNILIILLMLPLLAIAQEKQRMEDAIKKMEELKKNMTPEQRAMLEKMGLEKTMKTAQKNMQQGGTGTALMQMGDPNKIPEKLSTLAIPATPTDKGKLIAYLKPIFSQTETAMKPDHVKAVQKLLDKGAETGKYALVFWSHNELDKALYLLINACITNPDDYVSINNLGALLTLSGYAHKSFPLLLYTQKFVPQSGTLLNNIGQAYLSLGYVDKAKPLFLSAIAKDSTKTEAYRSMALIAQKQGDNALCGNYLEKAIAHGAATPENINLLKQVAPQKDISAHIRKRFKQFYKDHSVTKRFIVPSIPASYEEAVARDGEVEAYFRDFDATINATYKTQQELDKKYGNQVQGNQAKMMAQMQQTLANAGKPGFSKSVKDLKESFSNPFVTQASVMLASIDNPQFSKSYINRMKTETANRLASVNELKQALKTDFDDKINALVKEESKLKDGEGQDAANARSVEIEKQLCDLNTARQNKWLEKMAEINNQYIHKMEDLLNQRLQEHLFWNTIVMQSMQDPTAVNYAFYVGYLKDLYNLAYLLFPTHVDGGLSKPCGDYMKANNYRGKIHDWEREHCEVDFGIDLMVTGGKMNCEGWSVYADFKEGSFRYDRSVDPVTWQTTGHSITVKAGKEKEFEITKKLGGKIGAEIGTTIKFDGNMNPVDLIVKESVSAEMSGPMGGSAGVNLVDVEISVSSGFKATGSSIPGFGSDFLK